jgi:hypothetical protein
LATFLKKKGSQRKRLFFGSLLYVALKKVANFDTPKINILFLVDFKLKKVANANAYFSVVCSTLSYFFKP